MTKNIRRRKETEKNTLIEINKEINKENKNNIKKIWRNMKKSIYLLKEDKKKKRTEAIQRKKEHIDRN